MKHRLSNILHNPDTSNSTNNNMDSSTHRNMVFHSSQEHGFSQFQLNYLLCKDERLLMGNQPIASQFTQKSMLVRIVYILFERI
jgi:hypothetical protein